MSLTPRTASKLMLYPRHNFQIGREAHTHADVGRRSLGRTLDLTWIFGSLLIAFLYLVRVVSLVC